MSRILYSTSYLLLCLIAFAACNQQEAITEQVKNSVLVEETGQAQFSEMHQYGGWYCPDNFGFEPINIQELNKVPVVADRLPTIEETRNGTSLMYFNPDSIPDARPLDIGVPRVARYYSRQTEKEELVIIIQAVVAGDDTVVGFRFPSGGNGSAWYGEVDFLTDEEVTDLGERPFVYLHETFVGTKRTVWEAIAKSDYGQALGAKFGQQALFDSEWSPELRGHLHRETEDEKANGYIGDVWGNFYIQIDYTRKTGDYIEKILVSEKEDGLVDMHVVMGPYFNGIKAKKKQWESWFEKVKRPE